jgi:hypothetical protein
VIGGILLTDVVLLTAALTVTGGSATPFAVVLLANVTLAPSARRLTMVPR